MRIITGLLCLTACCFSACTNNRPDGAETPIGSVYKQKPVLIPTTADDRCFMRTSGSKNQDTLFIHLSITGEAVKGSMDELLFEKDSRRGLLSGTLSDDIVKATWTYQQEGTTSKLPIEAKLTTAGLWQRPVRIDPETGMQMIDTSKGFTELIPQINCP